MSQNESTTSAVQPVSSALKKAVTRIMVPLVHLLLKTGMTFPQFSELLKTIFIDVADSDFRLDDKKQTQTRLSFITGIHRKDIKRLHNKPRNLQEPENINVGVRLVSKWIKEPRYLNDAGKPLSLPLRAKGAPSFEELVESVCKQDIRPRVILDEWLNVGIVKLSGAKKVQLCSDAFIPKDGINEKAFFVGQNIADHLSAASKNLLNHSPAFFERCVYYDGLSEESITELKSLVSNQGMTMLKKINERAAQLKSQDIVDAKNKEKTQRINIGLYLYHEGDEAVAINERNESKI